MRYYVRITSVFDDVYEAEDEVQAKRMAYKEFDKYGGSEHIECEEIWNEEEE